MCVRIHLRVPAKNLGEGTLSVQGRAREGKSRQESPAERSKALGSVSCSKASCYAHPHTQQQVGSQFLTLPDILEASQLPLSLHGMFIGLSSEQVCTCVCTCTHAYVRRGLCMYATATACFPYLSAKCLFACLRTE